MTATLLACVANILRSLLLIFPERARTGGLEYLFAARFKSSPSATHPKEKRKERKETEMQHHSWHAEGITNCEPSVGVTSSERTSSPAVVMFSSGDRSGAMPLVVSGDD
ncbi:hypothetical protein DFJ73DRAFT_759112 [Zopfochytrium polystomum]|nr:hypothetical protein DFJ73DRAFT_759112 [Zopfochytrium polystomum]